MKTLLKNFTIVTMNENLDVLKDAHLIVEDGKITDVATGAPTAMCPWCSCVGTAAAMT